MVGKPSDTTLHTFVMDMKATVEIQVALGRPKKKERRKRKEKKKRKHLLNLAKHMNAYGNQPFTKDGSMYWK